MRGRARGVLGGVVVAAVVVATILGQTVGVPRDRLASLGPVVSASLVTVRPRGERRWTAPVPAARLAELDRQLRAHRAPLLGGGLSLPAVQLIVEDAAGRRSSFSGSSRELHPGGRCPEAILDLVRQIEDGDTRGWSPLP